MNEVARLKKEIVDLKFFCDRVTEAVRGNMVTIGRLRDEAAMLRETIAELRSLLKRRAKK